MHRDQVLAGRVYCQLKPDHSDDSPPKSPDISMLSSQLQQQWHIDRNMHLGAVNVKPQSIIKAVWAM